VGPVSLLCVGCGPGEAVAGRDHHRFYRRRRARGLSWRSLLPASHPHHVALSGPRAGQLLEAGQPVERPRPVGAPHYLVSAAATGRSTVTR